MTEHQSDDRLLEHDYDGIREYDNPMPRWWLYIFWATIAYSILYYFNVPGIGIGKGRIAAYDADVAEAAALAAKNNPFATVNDGVILAAAKDPAKLALGKTTFSTTCSACHRADGGGVIGPNLADDYWIHGGKPLEILKTVTEGVTAKGMPPWGRMLTPDQILSVVAYVTTLQGTNPPNPKAPQGVRADSTAPTPAAARGPAK